MIPVKLSQHMSFPINISSQTTYEMFCFLARINNNQTLYQQLHNRNNEPNQTPATDYLTISNLKHLEKYLKRFLKSSSSPTKLRQRKLIKAVLQDLTNAILVGKYQLIIKTLNLPNAISVKPLHKNHASKSVRRQWLNLAIKFNNTIIKNLSTFHTNQLETWQKRASRYSLKWNQAGKHQQRFSTKAEFKLADSYETLANHLRNYLKYRPVKLAEYHYFLISDISQIGRYLFIVSHQLKLE